MPTHVTPYMVLRTQSQVSSNGRDIHRVARQSGACHATSQPFRRPRMTAIHAWPRPAQLGISGASHSVTDRAGDPLYPGCTPTLCLPGIPASRCTGQYLPRAKRRDLEEKKNCECGATQQHAEKRASGAEPTVEDGLTARRIIHLVAITLPAPTSPLASLSRRFCSGVSLTACLPGLRVCACACIGPAMHVLRRSRGRQAEWKRAYGRREGRHGQKGGVGWWWWALDNPGSALALH